MFRLLLSFLSLLCLSSFVLAGVEQKKDSTGKTLKQVRDAYFARCLKFSGSTAKFTTLGSKKQPSAYYQLNKPYYKTTRTLFLTEADKLNGITLKTTSFVRSSAYRQQNANTSAWTVWRSGTPPTANWMSVYINLINGKFEVIPVSGSQYIRKSSSFASGSAPRTLRDLAEKP